MHETISVRFKNRTCAPTRSGEMAYLRHLESQPPAYTALGKSRTGHIRQRKLRSPLLFLYHDGVCEVKHEMPRAAAFVPTMRSDDGKCRLSAHGSRRTIPNRFFAGERPGAWWPPRPSKPLRSRTSGFWWVRFPSAPVLLGIKKSSRPFERLDPLILFRGFTVTRGRRTPARLPRSAPAGLVRSPAAFPASASPCRVPAA